ncbi:hypothetical protein [Endozoicomonas sp. 8E]|uniref:hypothetical protein n=1 Tax=Endozoicomonas sp. 8E TaxID=3035692 RepID=UPI0029391984|nr:hypothetical protein [Endozoicomonas sp. 8E]WOG26914.1 hypothetical protein P6910_20550 [Endozoicomonas sp. 8E]
MLPVVCQAEASTRRFIFELAQDASSSNQIFSIQRELPVLPIKRLDIVDTNDYTWSDLPSNEKRQRHDDYGFKATTIESFSWQWLYTTNLLAAYGLILARKDNPLPYSWVLVESVIAVGWLLKSYWNSYSPLFNPIGQKEASQEYTFTIITMMSGSEHAQHQGQPSESSGQQAPQVTTHPIGYFTASLNSEFGDGNQEPQEDLHTLGLHCFVRPCRGVCTLRPSSLVSEPAESPLNSIESSTGDQKFSITAEAVSTIDPAWPLDDGDLIIINGLLNLRDQSPFKGTVTSRALTHCQQALSNRKDNTGQYTCDATVVAEDDQQRPCGKVSKNASSLAVHKSKYHTGQQTCAEKVFREDGQLQSCGKVFKNARALWNHKERCHTGQQACDMIEVGEDGQQRPCGKVCKNSQALSNHKYNYHSGQQICNVKILKEDGQQRLCGKICKNVQVLSDHKRRAHTGKQTCDLIMIREDGQPRPCGTVCRSSRNLTDHKRRKHTGQQTCNLIVFGKGRRQGPCGKVCKGVQALSDHKRVHRKRKPADVDQNDNLGPQEKNKSLML